MTAVPKLLPQHRVYLRGMLQERALCVASDSPRLTRDRIGGSQAPANGAVQKIRRPTRVGKLRLIVELRITPRRFHV